MADLNTTLRLALRSPKEPLNSEPTEALHFPTGTGASVSGPPAPAVDSPVQAMALALKGLAPHADPPAGGSRSSSADDSPVKVIDGDHYAGASLP
jgi:hypothetical protein